MTTTREDEFPPRNTRSRATDGLLHSFVKYLTRPLPSLACRAYAFSQMASNTHDTLGEEMEVDIGNFKISPNKRLALLAQEIVNVCRSNTIPSEFVLGEQTSALRSGRAMPNMITDVCLNKQPRTIPRE